jgi:hypothetical protein
MKLIIESKYPHPFKTKRDPGDAEIIYESGQRTTEYGDLQDSFDKLVEETEGEESDSWSMEVSLDLDPKMKMVPVTKGTYPTEYNYDLVKSNVLLNFHSSESLSAVSKFKPTAVEVMNVARMLQNEQLSTQLMTMLFCDSLWLEEIGRIMENING